MGYDPNEPRDKRGEWTGGSGGDKAARPSVLSHPTVQHIKSHAARAAGAAVEGALIGAAISIVGAGLSARRAGPALLFGAIKMAAKSSLKSSVSKQGLAHAAIAGTIGALGGLGIADRAQQLGHTGTHHPAKETGNGLIDTITGGK